MVLVPLMVSSAHGAQLIMFEDNGCGWCRQWHKEVGPGYPKTAQGRHAPLVRHQVSDATPAKVSLQRPITSTPTFVLVEQGMEIGRMTGYPGADFFYGLLDELLDRLPDWKSRTKSGT
jgi:thioredoxin-related protein